jgi:hypothetical protein
LDNSTAPSRHSSLGPSFSAASLNSRISRWSAVALEFVSATDIGIAFSFRTRKLHAAEERLRSNSQDAAALILWRSGVIISYCFAEAVVLFGFVLKILGGPWNIASIFFAVGVLLMLLWTPRLDVPSAF